MTDIAIHSMRMAIVFHNQKNEELLETAVKSTDVSHRVAAAWAFGLQSIPRRQQQKLIHDFVKTQTNKIQTQIYETKRATRQHAIALQSLQNLPSIEPCEPKPFSNCILVLMRDPNPLVSASARDSCVAIASRRYKDLQVDFGPMYNSIGTAKDDAALLWEIYLEKKHKGNSTTNDN